MNLVEVSAPELTSDELETIDAYYRFVDPMLAINFEILTDDFVEWEAEGAVVRDRHGREYIDGMTFGGVFGLGHRHPRVVAAVKEQLDRMPLGTRVAFSKPLAQLSRLLAEITPGDLQHSFICSSGTESIEVALKMARLTTQRSQIISMMNSFHGMSIACSSVSGVAYWREGFYPLLDGCTLIPYGDVGALQRTIGPNTAAVLFETVQAGSGCTVAPDGFLTQVRELCTQHGALMIVDEIQTGFGRTGKMFGVNHEFVVPDMMCLGKFLGGGVMAIGACVFNPRVQRAVTQRPTFNNTTFGGNPLVCAAATAAIRVVLDDNLVEKSARLGERLQAGLDRLKEKYPKTVVDRRGRGLMHTFSVGDVRQSLPLLFNLLKEERLLLFSPVHTPTMFRVNPPQIVDEAFIDDLLARLDRAVGKVDAMNNDDLNRIMADIQAQAMAFQKKHGMM